MNLKPLIFIFVLSSVYISSACIVSAQVLTPEQRAKLEQELRDVEAEQKRVENDLANARNQTVSLSRDINILNAKIKDAQLKVKAKTLLIQTLGQDITVKQQIETFGVPKQDVEPVHNVITQVFDGLKKQGLQPPKLNIVTG